MDIIYLSDQLTELTMVKPHDEIKINSEDVIQQMIFISSPEDTVIMYSDDYFEEYINELENEEKVKAIIKIVDFDKNKIDEILKDNKCSNIIIGDIITYTKIKDLTEDRFVADFRSPFTRKNAKWIMHEK